MKTYSSNKATRGTKPYVDPAGEKPSGTRPMQSTQERGTSPGVRVVIPDSAGAGAGDTYNSNQRRYSNQAQFHENSEVPTNRLKDPLQKYMRKVLAPVQNPDADNNRTYSRKAPGRVVGRKRTL